MKQAGYPIFGNPQAGDFGLRSHNLDSKRPRISTSISLVSLELSGAARIRLQVSSHLLIYFLPPVQKPQGREVLAAASIPLLALLVTGRSAPVDKIEDRAFRAARFPLPSNLFFFSLLFSP